MRPMVVSLIVLSSAVSFEPRAVALGPRVTESILALETKMSLDDATVVATVNAVKRVYGDLDKSLLGDETKYKYVTILEMQYKNGANCMLSFSDQKPFVTLNPRNSDGWGTGGMMQWPQGTIETHFWIKSLNHVWGPDGTGSGANRFGWAEDISVRYRATNLAKMKPFLFL